jgi:hypothetical protein
MNILDELRKTIDSIPKLPLDGRIVLIPATASLRKIETDEVDEETGEVVCKVERILTPRSEYRWLIEECEKAWVEYRLSEFAPTTNDKGEPCIYTMEKPKPLGLLGGDFGYFPKKF